MSVRLECLTVIFLPLPGKRDRAKKVDSDDESVVEAASKPRARVGKRGFMV